MNKQKMSKQLINTSNKPYKTNTRSLSHNPNKITPIFSSSPINDSKNSPLNNQTTNLSTNKNPKQLKKKLALSRRTKTPNKSIDSLKTISKNQKRARTKSKQIKNVQNSKDDLSAPRILGNIDTKAKFFKNSEKPHKINTSTKSLNGYELLE